MCVFEQLVQQRIYTLFTKHYIVILCILFFICLTAYRDATTPPCYFGVSACNASRKRLRFHYVYWRLVSMVMKMYYFDFLPK